MKKSHLVLSGALRQEFQKDLELFKLFLLLLSNSSPIRNVDLMWSCDLDPQKEKYKNRVGTEDALVELKSATTLVGNRNSPSTLFCDMVHGWGAHEETTCAHSDRPAQQRCQASACAQVYTCHVGLTDIAVPVICEGQYLGTLFSGQVLTQRPTPKGFAFVRKSLEGQTHIDFTALEKAYFSVPVVTREQVADMVRVLELFARYIANSWKRLQIIREAQQHHDREVHLNRKELAAILLSGEALDRHELEELAARAELNHVPNCVLVAQIEQPVASPEPIDLAAGLRFSRAGHVLDSYCQSLPDTVACQFRPGELCVFTHVETRNDGHGRILLQDMARGMLQELKSRLGSGARIGISAFHASSRELLQAYHEACSALSSQSDAVIAFYGIESSVKRRPTEAMEQLVTALRQDSGVSAAIRHLLTQLGSNEHGAWALQQSRAMLTWAVEHLALEVASAGADRLDVAADKERALAEILHAPTLFGTHEAFRGFVERIALRISTAFTAREEKIVHTVTRIVQEKGAAHVTIQNLAADLHLSPGHLSRVFRRTTNVTLEVFLIRQRIELAKRMLLDPRLNIAEVAERCGFCNPAYFASVFKKYVGHTPREFARQPQRWSEGPSFAASSAHPSV